MNRDLRSAIGIFLPLLLTAGWVAAQSGQGEITGLVKDPSGAGIPAATLTLTNEDSGVTQSLTTSPEGRYLFAAVPVGRYSVKVEVAGFKPITATGIDLVIDQHVIHDFLMAVGNVTESITVSAEPPPIDVTKSEVSGVVSQRQIDTLPVAQRAYLNLSLLEPGTSQDASRTFYNNVQVGGSDHYYGNGFQVDGVTNTWAEMGEPRQNFPMGAVEEFKLNTNQYSADSGLSMGGLVQVVTKSGTNQFHGEIFEYWRNRVLNRDNSFQKAAEQQEGVGKAPFNRNQFGADFGGPIVKNKLHFYVSYDDTEQASSFTIYIPGAVGQDYSTLQGIFPVPSHDRLFNARLDYQVSSKQRLFARYSDEWNLLSYNGCGGQSESNCYDGQVPRHSLVIGHTWTPKSNLVNDLRLQYAFASYELGPSGLPIWTQIGVESPARLAQLQPVLSFPSFSYGFDYSDVGIERRYEAKDDVLWQKGSHSIKFGVDYSQVPFADDAPAGYAGTFTFAHDHPFNPKDPASLAALAASNDVTQFTATIPPIYTSETTKQLGLYIMDEWRIRSGLTATVGLRYDREFGDFDENLKPSQFPVTIPFLGDPSQRGAKHNFGPRIGLAWDVTGHSKDVVRLGYGIYYNNLQTLQNFPELRNLAQCSVLIKPASYPNPFGSQSASSFCSTAAPTVTILSPDYRNPSSQQFNLGYARTLPGGVTVNVDGVYTHTFHDYRTVDLNYPLTGATVNYGALSGTRPLTSWARILEHDPISQSKYKALYVRAERRFANRYQFLVSYSVSSCTDDNPQGSIVDPANYRLDWGPCAIDRRHNLVVSGSINLPWKLTFGAIWYLRSALPFSALTAITDIDGNRQYIPGTSRNQGERNLNMAAVNAYRATLGLAPVTGIDSSRYDDLDTKISRKFQIKEKTYLELSAQVFNTLGTQNLGTSSGQVSSGGNNTAANSATFGKILGAFNLQQAELVGRIVF
jgi:hypothetical protein